MVIDYTDKDFENILTTDNTYIIKFGANWCGICRLFSPKFLKISNKSEFAHISFIDINAEENINARMVSGVNGLPFVAIFKNGKLIASQATSKSDVVEKLLRKISADL